MTLKDSYGRSALHMAAKPWWSENVDVVQLLVDGGCNLNERDESGRTPLDIAKEAGFEHTCDALSNAR